ncbi:Vta1 like-domain-containing protein [Fomitopsis serialis]|uniref:Vta1 like-domain-containing protein n=1 Tax=Fomitopsis serialis TaxID=139415 RepID=UPI00200773DF|nr:Vta1 like-domain-containing protein [Neoantrodia serialis]KAH9937210.1 Vta1 like-domain-containing protein [Neoantrodia serialis]
MTFMDLPAVPPELKNVTPYVQRAEELFSQDPVVSYWSAYYGAQVGIASKSKAPASRKYLFNLLDALERLKVEIGDNDAVHDEFAASAYVENFALKVFGMADNEDRRGAATRGTAKKFLAAANFLEILRTFDKEKTDAASPTPDSTEDKIRYAKWKAADIAKAFREGRKPTPGPAGSEPEPASAPASPPADAPSFTRATPPPPAITDLPASQQVAFFQQDPRAYVPDELLAHTLPGASSSAQSLAWSTAATPGTPGRPLDAATSRNNLQVSVSGELEGRPDDEITPVEEVPSRMGVRFSPSATGGDSPPANPSTLPPPADSQETGLPAGFVPERIEPDPSAPPMEDLPPGFVPSAPVDEPEEPSAPYGEPSSPYGEPSSIPLSPDAPVVPSGRPVVPYSPPPSVPPPAPIVSIARAPMMPIAPMSPMPGLDTTATAVPVELTPVVIARAQRHCKFAVSALDYEDAEQARKELRTALRLLGG